MTWVAALMDRCRTERTSKNIVEDLSLEFGLSVLCAGIATAQVGSG
jgi:hypothetical protein